ARRHWGTPRCDVATRAQGARQVPWHRRPVPRRRRGGGHGLRARLMRSTTVVNHAQETRNAERGTRNEYRGAYDLTEEQELFKQTVHEFGVREIVPIAHDLDEREEFPRESVRKMGELGLLGLLVPEEYGGAGATTVDYALAMEEISWADASHSVIVSVNNSLVCEPIVRFGTASQKERYLPGLARGEFVGAYCLSEPSSGSDASNMSTVARRDGDGFVLNGTKSWVNNGAEDGV